MKLFGSLTSPFVRRVRVVCSELALPFTLVDAFNGDGPALLKKASPVWKVPTVELHDGRVIWDSHAIIDFLIAKNGPGALRVPAGDERWDDINVHNAVDEALNAAIKLFYLKRDGASIDSPSLQKDQARIGSIMAWLDSAVDPARALGLSELAVITAMDWMSFRKQYDVDQHARLVELRAMHASRPSLATTRPA